MNIGSHSCISHYVMGRPGPKAIDGLHMEWNKSISPIFLILQYSITTTRITNIIFLEKTTLTGIGSTLDLLVVLTCLFILSFPYCSYLIPTPPVKMRFEDWDVLLFPRDSKIPMKEFRTNCHVVHDNGECHSPIEIQLDLLGPELEQPLSNILLFCPTLYIYLPAYATKSNLNLSRVRLHSRILWLADHDLFYTRLVPRYSVQHLASLLEDSRYQSVY